MLNKNCRSSRRELAEVAALFHIWKATTPVVGRFHPETV